MKNALTPRFTVRFTNGFWKLFDNRAFREVARFDLQQAAVKAAAKENRQ